MDARDASAIAWMYAGHCATRCGLKEHASRSSSRFGARVASLARRDGASKRDLTSSHDRDVWWFRRGRKVSSRARRAASDASTRFVAAWRRAASILLWASAERAGRAFALAVTSGLRVVYPSKTPACEIFGGATASSRPCWSRVDGVQPWIRAIPARCRRDVRKRTLGPRRNVSRGRGASGGFFASDSRWPENFSLSPLAMRWRRRASRRFWRSSNFELRAILLEFSQSLG